LPKAGADVVNINIRFAYHLWFNVTGFARSLKVIEQLQFYLTLVARLDVIKYPAFGNT
jgi:hypothetical protein